MNRGDTCRITKTKRCCRLFLDKLYKTCLLGFQFGSPVGRRWTAGGSSYVHSTTVVSEASLPPLLWLHNKDIYDRFFFIIKGVKQFGFGVSSGRLVCALSFFRACIQTRSPASREELMNNYFHIFQTLKHFCCAQTLGAGLIMLFACLRTTFFFFAQQSLQPLAF